MGSEWQETTIAEFTPFSYGKGLPERRRNINGNIPVYGSNGVVGYHDVPLTDGPTVVIGRKGTVGAVHYSPEACWPIDTTFFITGSDSAQVRYCYYVLKTLGLEHMNSDSAVPGLNREAAHSRRVRIPLDKGEQHAIACILGALDDKIELNLRMNETLEAMARAIFKSWFVDFDPVRAKAEGQLPPGLKPEITDLFPDAFEDSELGEIPKGWEVSNVGQHFHLTMGQSPPGSTYNETGEGLPFYQGRKDFGFRFPSRRVFCTAATRFAEPGDSLVSVRAPVGAVNMASELCAVGRGVAAIRHRSGSRSFTYYSMHYLGDYFGKFEAEGTVFGSINKNDFEFLSIIAPSPDVLTMFDRVASPLDDRIETNERQTSILSALRDTLLPKLISGELRVPDAESILNRCV